MNTSENKWLYILLAVLIAAAGINIWISLRSKKNINEYPLQRDTIIEQKIDSIMQSVNSFRELYGNDRLLADKERKIINNYSIFNKKRNEFFKNPVDSIYNWTKYKLGPRAK